MVRIIATSDTHQNFSRMAKLNAIVRNARGIKVNAGDSQSGRSPDFWRLCSFLDSLARYDVQIFGNHECFLSPEKFVERIHPNATPFLATSLDKSRMPAIYDQLIRSEKLITDEAMIVTSDEKRIAFIDALWADENDTSNDVKHGYCLQKEYLLTRISSLARKLKENDCVDAVVLVSHRGYNWDKNFAQSAAANDIDIVIGSHSHGAKKGLVEGETFFTKANGKKILVVNPGALAEYVNFIDFDFDQAGDIQFKSNQLVEVDKSAEVDPETLEALKKIMGPDCFEHVINVTNEGSYNFKRIAQVCAVAQALKETTKADIGISKARAENKLSLEGDVKLLDIDFALPLREDVHVVSLKGSDIIEVLRNNLLLLKNPTAWTDFLCFSGLRYKVVNDELQKVQVKKHSQWCDIDDKEEYSIAVSSYISSGRVSSDWGPLTDNPRIDSDTGHKVSDIMRDYLLQYPGRHMDFQAIDPAQVKLVESYRDPFDKFE